MRKGGSDSFRFEILHQSKKSKARVGILHTPNGIVETPGFVPVGTNGTLKGVSGTEFTSSGLQLMFANTYHLMLQPGTDVIKTAGGLHKFMNHTGPLITDSGGFQVFSLAAGVLPVLPTDCTLKGIAPPRHPSSVLNINEKGVAFRSYRTGERILLTPESSILAQKDIGADIILPLDELPSSTVDEATLKASLIRTHRWQHRSFVQHKMDIKQQAIFGIVHGGMDFTLRKHSLDELHKDEWNGYCIGGHVGHSREAVVSLLSFLQPHFHSHLPRHLLGIADPVSIPQCVPYGIDTFDSCFATRVARHGTLFSTTRGKIYLRRGKWKNVRRNLSYL